MKTKMIRWVCPACGGGKLAPSRPRRDDVRRYCLLCSEKTGRLVERSAPVLEAKRVRGAERSKVKASVRRQRAAEAKRAAEYVKVVEADGSTGELHVRRTMAKMAKLKAVRAASVFVYAMVPDIEFSRSRSKPYSSGHAYSMGGPIHITFGKNISRAEAEVTMLHELAHAIMPHEEHHGRRWRDAYVRACHQWFGPEFDEPRGDDEKWELDDRMRAEAWRVLKLAVERTAA